MKKVLNLCQDTREMYILNAKGTPKRIPVNQWRLLMHNRIKVDADDLGNKKFVLKRREDYKDFKEITLAEYEEITGMSIIDGRWRKRPATKAQAIVETVKEPENLIMETPSPTAKPRTNRKRKR